MSASRTRIVIIGGGYGGAYCAQALGKKLKGLDADVLLIDRNNYFIIYPLLVEAGTGSLEPRHAVVPIRSFVRTGEFRMAEVVGVDLERQEVRYRLGRLDRTETVAYDHLVVAVGSVTRWPDVPGLREHGYEMKTLGDAVGLRDRAIRALEFADAIDDPVLRKGMLSLVVVGGNFTGAEVAGEYDMFVKQAAKHYPRVEPRECRVTIVELSDRILGALGEELSDFAMTHLRRRGFDLRLKTTVSAVHEDRVELSDGSEVEARTVIWCAGIAPSPLIGEIGLPVDERGYVLCDRDLRVRGCDNVWAIGDAAINPDAEGGAYPATAQHAVREGTHAAANIVAVLRSRPTRPCNLANLGSLAALGCRTGVAKIFGVKLSGFPAWWMWRTVYLLKMPTLSRKIRVAIDWTIDLVFSRDYVELGVHSRKTPKCRNAKTLKR